MSGRFIYKGCREQRRKQNNFFKKGRKHWSNKHDYILLRNFENRGNVKKLRVVNTKYCFRRNIEDYIADKGKESGTDYLSLIFDRKLFLFMQLDLTFYFHLNFLSILDNCDFIN